MLKYILFTLALCCCSVNAKLFTSSGEAFIIKQDIDSARDVAIKEALKNALIYSGGPISILQQVNNGVLVENKLVFNSKGEINSLTIIDENVKEDKLMVTISVDIELSHNSCQGAQYPKSIAITRFKLNNPNHAVDGQIHTINKQITQTLFNRLKLSPQQLDVRELIDIPVRLGQHYSLQNISNTLSTMATQTDSQYIFYAEINDLSVDFDSKNSINYWLVDPLRNFYMTVYLYDALQGTLVMSKQYRTEAKWEYGMHESADLQSKLFWQREYGQAIINLLANVNEDINKQLQCMLPIARVISVKNNSVQINLGKRNGLKEGETLTLFYSSNYKDQFGIERNAETQYQDPMQVIEVHDSSAILRTIDNYPLGNIQINDLAKIK
ncbi:flagellar assembly protein T N-terminal domain-containing protein [Psychromonas sp. MME2]|uniref:flagellar assembly protein T N-terminal domain-containing protein n=1 Tax=unclassified Psychromonas TaxID=2614957 RepID=UPI00339C98B4